MTVHRHEWENWEKRPPLYLRLTNRLTINLSAIRDFVDCYNPHRVINFVDDTEIALTNAVIVRQLPFQFDTTAWTGINFEREYLLVDQPEYTIRKIVKIALCGLADAESVAHYAVFFRARRRSLYA